MNSDADTIRVMGHEYDLFDGVSYESLNRRSSLAECFLDVGVQPPQPVNPRYRLVSDGKTIRRVAA